MVGVYPPVAASTLMLSPVDPHQHVPLIEALRSYRSRGTVPFSTPGHKLGAGFDDDLRDLLGDQFGASDVWLNTALQEQTLRAAEALAAEAWGAERTFFLVNGSSSGNLAFFLATVLPGEQVLVGRDLHQSLLAALILTGARPVYVTPRLHSSLHLGLGVAVSDVVAAMEAYPAAKLLAVTSPTYWGVCNDLPGIVAAARTRGVAVYVDEAWGPHLGFHPQLPPAAMESGAAGAVTSPHKLLTGLSQAAILNVRGPSVDPSRVAGAVKLTQSTSPLLPLLASLDACRRQMALYGEEMLTRTIDLAAAARMELRALHGIDVHDAVRLGLPASCYDPTRLVIDTQGLGMSGYMAERILRERFGIAPEMSDAAGIVCLVTVGDSRETVRHLVRAVAALGPPRSTSLATCPRVAGEAVAAGKQALTPREAYFARTRTVPLAEAVGHVAAEAVVPYPPGIPVLTPGEVIDEVKIDCLKEGLSAGMHVRGAADPTLQTLRVVEAA